MNGVEILKETAIYENLLPPWLLVVLFFASLVSIVIAATSFIYYRTFSEERDKTRGLVFLFIGIILVLSWVLGLFPSSYVAYTEYKVTIDESVSFTEFTEKYEIIDQEGKIYTVKEK